MTIRAATCAPVLYLARTAFRCNPRRKCHLLWQNRNTGESTSSHPHFWAARTQRRDKLALCWLLIMVADPPVLCHWPRPIHTTPRTGAQQHKGPIISGHAYAHTKSWIQWNSSRKGAAQMHGRQLKSNSERNFNNLWNCYVRAGKLREICKIVSRLYVTCSRCAHTHTHFAQFPSPRRSGSFS